MQIWKISSLNIFPLAPPIVKGFYRGLTTQAAEFISPQRLLPRRCQDGTVTVKVSSTVKDMLLTFSCSFETWCHMELTGGVCAGTRGVSILAVNAEGMQPPSLHAVRKGAQRGPSSQPKSSEMRSNPSAGEL